MNPEQASAVVKWCAEECERQRSGERSVSWMFDGWKYARSKGLRRPTARDVLALGAIVEPRKAASGFRQCEVSVGWERVEMPWQQVSRAIKNLMRADLSPEQFFFHYETIHPFRDGNGRTGAILLNWLGRTLDWPLIAPLYRKPDSLIPGQPSIGEQ